MKLEVTLEEKQTILRAIRHWQYQVPVTHPDYQICDNILHQWYDEVHKQQQEQPQ